MALRGAAPAGDLCGGSGHAGLNVVVKVLIASPLLSYTSGQAWVQARGATLGEVLSDLDRQYPGLRFRVIDEQDRTRANMRFFLNGHAVFDLGTQTREADELCLVAALSGG